MTLDVTLESETVRADAQAMRSILTRLLDNAVKFGDSDSTISLTSREAGGDSILVSLANEGKGVKAEMIEKILKPFSLDEDVMHHSKGTGLGLSVVQALLHRMGSQLEIHSAKGRFEASFSLKSG
ncbi:MAG: ATP-binding protein [Calothrix sp. SM1_5_4]|nr:ATP-binding protein [Calothrix sp. SM1_5_4]